MYEIWFTNQEIYLAMGGGGGVDDENRPLLIQCLPPVLDHGPSTSQGQIHSGYQSTSTSPNDHGFNDSHIQIGNQLVDEGD